MIYADNAATTQISDLAYEAMVPFLRDQYGNASSQYMLGAKAKGAIERARLQTADAIGANPAEIFFTSGGSETNSWVLGGVTDLYSDESIHIITSSVEHSSILNACHALEARGVDLTYLPVSNDGVISVADIKAAIRPNTKLVSIMLANNEIGTIQPIAEIGAYLRTQGILLHTDAVQAVGHIRVDVEELKIDFLSASAHKFNGAKGAGFLYKRSGVILPNMLFGGAQEQGHRAGTENVAGIVALGTALEESVLGLEDEQVRMKELTKKTIDGLRLSIPGISVNGEHAIRLPNILNITIPKVSGESLLHLLDLKGICISTSSACNAGKDEPSHVLLALGLSEEQAKSTIRLSYGKYNTRAEIELIVKEIVTAYKKIIGAQ